MAVYEAWRNTFQISTTGKDEDDAYAIIADVESFEVSFDGNVEEWNPYDTKGWTRRLKTGNSITISVTAKRNLGDTANDYLANLTTEMGTDAETYVKWTMYDGTIITMLCVVNVTSNGAGATRDVAPLEAEFLSNGIPTITLPS